MPEEWSVIKNLKSDNRRLKKKKLKEKQCQ